MTARDSHSRSLPASLVINIDIVVAGGASVLYTVRLGIKHIALGSTEKSYVGAYGDYSHFLVIRCHCKGKVRQCEINSAHNAAHGIFMLAFKLYGAFCVSIAYLLNDGAILGSKPVICKNFSYFF